MRKDPIRRAQSGRYMYMRKLKDLRQILNELNDKGKGKRRSWKMEKSYKKN